MAIDPESGQHRVFIMERGGRRRIAELKDIERVIWRRVRDDISVADINIASDAASAQAPLLRRLVTAAGRYELMIVRGRARVWEGPITLLTFHREGVEIRARDVMHYASRTVMHAAYDNSYPNVDFVVNRAKTILATELARKEALDPPINVVPFIVDHQTSSDAKTTAKTNAYQFTVFEHIDSLAASRGMDYTVVGRAIHLWDTSKAAMGQTPEMTETDFLGEIYVSVYAMELATRTIATDGQGAFGTAGGIDDFYGEVERLDTAYDENATAAPTTAELASQAQRNLAGRNPTPLAVRVPDNSSLDLRGNFTISMLVPGIYIPLRATLNLVQVEQMQKLQTLTVTEDEKGETIQITLYPASDEDVEEES